MKNQTELQQEAERIYHEWDRALANNDVEALIALYTTDAIIESPLIPHLLQSEKGICKGHKEIRRLLEEVKKRKPPIRKYYRKGFFTDGKTLMWEYPRQTPGEDQMDFVEVMELKDGLIAHHRVYWGWRGLKVMQENEYHSKKSGSL